MIFKSFTPSQELDGMVKTYHLRHFQFPPNATIPFKPFPPRDEQYLNFYIRGFEKVYFQREEKTETRKNITIIGQSTQMVYRMISHQFLLIQVPFYPGALYRLTKIPFYELKDKSIDLDLIFPRETKELQQRLSESLDYKTMINLVDQFLINLFRKHSSNEIRPFDKALSIFSTRIENNKVEDLAYQACVSTRQLERLSNRYFGVGPKTMLRINRITWSFILKSRNPNLSWLDVALICGYEDYQHLAKDYKDLAGITPSQLWNEDSLAPDRALGLRK